jgi:hypothetical protein
MPPPCPRASATSRDRALATGAGALLEQPIDPDMLPAATRDLIGDRVQR